MRLSVLSALLAAVGVHFARGELDRLIFVKAGASSVQRTRMPPPLRSAINPDGSATVPRWWARGHWRLLRRIRTDDVTPIWYATLAIRLCRDLANQTRPPDPEFAPFVLGAANLALGGNPTFDVPLSKDDWLQLCQDVYAPHNGALNNRTGGTFEQYEAEKAFTVSDMSGFDLMFGRH